MPHDGSCRAVVEKVAEGKAFVAVTEEASCASCKGEGTCGFGGGRRPRRVWVWDPFGVRVGDAVRVEVSDEGLLAASLVLWGLPLAGLLAGAVVGHLTGGEKRSLGGALLGLLASAPLVRVLGNRIPTRARFGARIVQILGRDDS